MSKIEPKYLLTVQDRSIATGEALKRVIQTARYNGFEVSFIDSGICFNELGNCRDFRCSECGYEADTYGDSDCDPSNFDYCPRCGRVVVEV